MDVSGLFSISGLLQVIALGALLWVIQNSYGSQLQQQSRAAAVPSVGPMGLSSALPGTQQQSKNNKKKKGNNADGSSQAQGAAGSTAAQEEDRDSIMREVLQDYLGKAEAFRADLNDKRLTVEHMVLAMAEDPRFGEILSVAEGLDSENIKKAIRKSRVVFNRGGADEPQHDTGVLAKYSRDLTALAAEGKLDPVIGRHDEMRRLIDVVCRRTKNSVVLLGEPGVGKTAIVQGLAQRLSEGDVPDSLRESRLIALELGLLMAGATFPGEFEERLRGVLAELTAAGSKAILFIDDIHGITGPNAQQGGGVMDASVLLKPLLARGEVRVVGCTSQDKYRRFIEKDPGLERRFQTVDIVAPGVHETLRILRGLRHKYEAHHGVRITDAALAAAAQLSDRYLPDRHLPDKAIDLVDEAASKVKTDLVLKPEALDRVERRIRELQAERKLLLRTAELDASTATDLQALEAELARLQESVVKMSTALEAETQESDRGQRLQDDLDRLDAEIEAAEEAGQQAKAEQLRKARRAELIRKLRQLQRRNVKQGHGRKGAAAVTGSGKLSRAEVGETDVARIISSWTGIPLTKLVENEADKLLLLADDLHKRIIGQDEAVVAVAEAIQRSRAGMKDPNGPIASFLFLGPTGVGKTELAKALAQNLFNTEQAMIRLDMSEYMEKHAVAKMIGAPPGYAGYDEGGQLTEQIRRRQYSVVLFDEVEKAHVDVFNLLLQILDDGRVTDSQGRVVSFRNAIIILTSNLGSAEIFNNAYKAQHHGGKEADVRELVMEKVRRHFQPEFLNRIDEFIIFEPLSNAQIRTIVEIRVIGVVKRVAERKITLTIKDSAIQHLAEVGFDPVYGARPVKRAIQRELETPLAQALLRGQFQEYDTIIVEADPQQQQQLRYSRIPAPVDPMTESDSEDVAAPGASSTSSSSKSQQQAGVPIPVIIPNTKRHSVSSSSSSKPPVAAAAAVAAAGKQQKFDPLRQRSKGSSSKPVNGSADTAAADKASRPAATTPAADGVAADKEPGMPVSDASAAGQEAAAAPKREESSGSVNALVDGLDAAVAARLDRDNLPAFLRTPVRRDEQTEMPTLSY